MEVYRVLEILEIYEKLLVKRGAKPVKMERGNPFSREKSLDHLLSMIPQMREFAVSGKKDKLFRWLGFMQGVLWMNGIFTIEQLKNHNRPSV